MLARLGLDVRVSLASARDAGCTRSPRSSSTPVTGGWASQSISRSGCLARSSPAIARSRRTWPSPIGELTYSTRLRRSRALVQVRGAVGAAVVRGRRPSDSVKSRMSRFIRTGSRIVGAWPPPWMVTSCPPVIRASATPVSCGTIRSSWPCTTSTGQRT